MESNSSETPGDPAPTDEAAPSPEPETPSVPSGGGRPSVLLMVWAGVAVVGFGLLTAVLILQIREYLYYQAPPSVWPPAIAEGAPGVATPAAPSAAATPAGTADTHPAASPTTPAATNVAPPPAAPAP